MNINRLIVFVSLFPSTHLIERQHKHDWYGCTIPSPLHAHTRYCLPSPQLQNKISTKTRMSPVHWDFNMLLWCVWVLDSICKIKNRVAVKPCPERWMACGLYLLLCMLPTVSLMFSHQTELHFCALLWSLCLWSALQWRNPGFTACL